MSDLVQSKYHDSEISKSDDFNFTAGEVADFFSAIFDEAFDDVENSFVVAGMRATQLASPSMNVQVNPGLAFSRSENRFLHSAFALSTPVNASHPVLDRYDTLEMRYATLDFDSETRAFKNPATGAITYAVVNTKTKIFVEIRCVTGVVGSGVAPSVSSGWMKLAEILIPFGATQIVDGNIRNITAQEDAEENSAWTANKAVSFSLGSIESIKNTLYSHVRNNVTSINTVHGIRQGHGNGLDADTLDGTHAADAKKVFGEYEAETVTIPGSTDKKLMFTNKQAGKEFSITETRGPAGETVEATHSLGAVAGDKDWIFDFSLHNYSGSMKGVYVLSIFNADTKAEIQWVLKRRPNGQSGYGDTQDYYVMQISEDGSLEINTGKQTGPLPTWSRALTTADEGHGNGLDADTLDGKQAGNEDGNIPVSNGTKNTNLNADMLDGLHETSFFRPRGPIPSGNGNLISYWAGLDSGIYLATPNRVTGQPSDYGIVIIERDSTVSAEVQVTWKTQPGGNIYRRSCNQSTLSDWETYVTSSNIPNNGIARTSYFPANGGVGVSTSVHGSTTFGALWSLLHGPLSGVAGSHMIVSGGVAWPAGRMTASKAVRQSDGSITLLGMGVLTGYSVLISLNLTSGNATPCEASLAC